MTHVALLRAVNLPGRNRVRMADLRQMLGDLGLGSPRSLQASGNLVFASEDHAPAELEPLLEEAAHERLGLETDIFVRTVGEWRALVEANPFPSEAEDDPSHLVLLCLKDRAAPDRVEALQAWIPGREVVGAEGRHVWAVYPDGIGRSKLTTAKMESFLETRLTGRNWNTVGKLEEMMREEEDS